jgi:hypothetical protein
MRDRPAPKNHDSGDRAPSQEIHVKLLVVVDADRSVGDAGSWTVEQIWGAKNFNPEFRFVERDRVPDAIRPRGHHAPIGEK